MSIFSKNDLDTVQEVIKGNGTVSRKNDPEQEELAELNRKSERIQQLLQEIENLTDENARRMMQECMQETLSFYGHGLDRILRVITSGDASASKDIFNKLIEDTFINGLLLIHDLHPLDLTTRLHMALDKVRPYMDSHGGRVEIIDLSDGIATIKLDGNCKGCPSSASTLELGIKQAIEELCPDLLELRLEGAGMSTISINGSIENGKEKSWQSISGIDNLKNGEMRSKNLGGIQILFCKVNDRLYAYRDVCPACSLTLHNGQLEKDIISCKLGHHFNVVLAGKSTDNEDVHLAPLPLIEENGEIKVSISEG